jgi:tol-pal system protein YbgF
LLVIGCATTFAGSSQDPVGETAAAATGDDLAQIKERVLELQRQAVMADVEIERLRRQVVALESRLTGGTAVEERLSAPVGVPEPWSPPPAVEESDLETEPVAVAESVAAYESGVEEAPIPPPPVAPQNDPVHEPITAAAQALYDRGYTLYHQGRYVDAEASFQQFLQGHGDTELTDNAQYWVGECRFARGDFRGALAAFQMTVDRFPEGNKVSDAILKMGDAHQALQETERARERWEEVRRRFPGSAAATVAEDRLAG